MQKNIPTGYAFEILVINNDEKNYCQTVIKEIKPYRYVVHCIDVKQPGFANVRNAAVSWVLKSDMDALIFVDDDEVVPSDWLANMITAWSKYGGDIITGPVRQVLPSSASRFAKMFHLFESDYHKKSGQKLQYANSNNTLVSKKVFEALGPTFHPSLNRSGGEDILYFHQAYLKGFTIYWDNYILIEEPTISERATTYYILCRRFHNGVTRIVIHRILYPEDWTNFSFNFILKIIFSILRGFAASVVRLNKRSFGQTVRNLAWLGGNIAGLLGIVTTNRTHNKENITIEGIELR
jgi:succinoglycan biosynthesis protein ExoM